MACVAIPRLRCAACLSKTWSKLMTVTRSAVPVASANPDGEVRPLGLLYLEEQTHLRALGPIEDLRDGWNRRTGKSRIKGAASIQPADLLEAQVSRESVAVGGAVECAVVKYDGHCIRGQHDVGLYGRRTARLGRLEGRHRVLRVAEAVAAMPAQMDAPGLAGKKAEGHRVEPGPPCQSHS